MADVEIGSVLTSGLVRVDATVDEVAEMLVRIGYPKDAERLLAAQAKRDRKAEKRARDAADFIPSPGYAEMPDWVPR